jgi:hypothetical protein
MPSSVGDHVSPFCSITHIPEYVFVVFYTQPPTLANKDGTINYSFVSVIKRRIDLLFVC